MSNDSNHDLSIKCFTLDGWKSEWSNESDNQLWVLQWMNEWIQSDQLPHPEKNNAHLFIRTLKVEKIISDIMF